MENQELLEQVTEVIIFGESFNIYGDINNPLFLAVEVAEKIEYSTDKVGQMLELVDDDEKLTDTIYRAGQRREVWFLTEAGLYELLMQSRKRLAKRFKHEIKVMLHEIRLGMYQRRAINRQNDNTLSIAGATIMFRNFSGKQTEYNRKGDRNFCVLLDSVTADQLLADGWNIKSLKKKNEDDEQRYYVQVTVRYDNFPPRIYMYVGRKKTLLDEETVGLLDKAELSNVDLVISPSNWNVNGGSGVKAYVKTMHATIAEDVFASKYDYDDDVPFN